MTQYTKLDSTGAALPPEADGHLAVQVEHPLLAAPLIFTAHRSKAMTHKAAIKWAADLDINGWSWRLPTVEEAFFLADRSKYPALDVKYFPDFDGEWIWTSTLDAENPSVYAWLVDLDDGDSTRPPQSRRYHVRAVRASQSNE